MAEFKSFLDFARYFNAADAIRNQVEQEANEFAGQLLVPTDRLRAYFEIFKEEVRKTNPRYFLDENLRKKLAESLAPKFGVHPQTILTRFNREEIWPGS